MEACYGLVVQLCERIPWLRFVSWMMSYSKDEQRSNMSAILVYVKCAMLKKAGRVLPQVCCFALELYPSNRGVSTMIPGDLH